MNNRAGCKTLTGFSILKRIAARRMNIIAVLLHIVYMDTVMYMKLQLESPISIDAVIAEERRYCCNVLSESLSRNMALIQYDINNTILDSIR